MEVSWKVRGSLAGAGLALLMASGSSFAADILCEVATNNHMLVDDSQVTACVDAGVGNIGNGQNDDFLNGGGTALGYVDVGDGTFTQTGNTGTWSFDASLWSQGPLAIGFKFGSGNTPDEWFIYNLVTDVSSGSYTFVNVLAPGSDDAERLSHISIYSYPGDDDDDDDDDDTDVPEPGTLALLGLGLMGLGMVRRRR